MVKYFFHKLTHWEYWPQWIVYAPISPIYLFYSLKAKTPFFHVASNPYIEYGGYQMESKYDIHLRLPENYKPLTIKIFPGTSSTELIKQFKNEGFKFPVFCKPDVGGKGQSVGMINSEKELLHYHEQAPLAYLIQEEIPYQKEVGIFYCRLPQNENGIVTGIVSKEYMTITGNGKQTVKQLIEKTPRYYFQRKYLFSKWKEKLYHIPAVGEEIILSQIGNHSRGSKFIDNTHLNNAALQLVIDKISKQYKTFYFGRYDIKYDNWDDLCKSQNFMIVELNGAGSEPTHIYDPRKKIWRAWKILIHHWKWMYKISKTNHKKGTPYLSLRQGLALNKEAARVGKLWQQSGLG